MRFLPVSTCAVRWHDNQMALFLSFCEIPQLILSNDLTAFQARDLALFPTMRLPLASTGVVAYGLATKQVLTVQEKPAFDTPISVSGRFSWRSLCLSTNLAAARLPSQSISANLIQRTEYQGRFAALALPLSFCQSAAQLRHRGAYPTT